MGDMDCNRRFFGKQIWKCFTEDVGYNKLKFKRTMTSKMCFYTLVTAIVSGLSEAKRDRVPHEQFLPVKCFCHNTQLC